MENLFTFLLVVFILIFHRPLGAILGGLFALALLGVVLVLLFFLLRSVLFGSLHTFCRVPRKRLPWLASAHQATG